MDALKIKGIKLFGIFSLFALGLSQLGSYLIQNNLALHRSVSVLPFLHFTHVRNEGGVFGIMQGSGWVFTAVSIVFMIGLIVFVVKDKQLKIYEYVCCGLILGGGSSNIMDRFVYGSVIDFIDVKGIPGWEYVFNTADTFIHLGIWPWLLMSFLQARKETQGDS